MKVGIIGAGLQGLCTAHYLTERGVDVTIIEQEDGPGLQTSFGNGGCFTYSLPTVWNSPDAFKMFTGSILRPSSAPIQFRLKALPGMMAWGIHFLKYANEKDFFRLTDANKRLASFSQQCFETLLDETGIDCHYIDKGFLEIFENEVELNEHAKLTKSLVDDPEKVRVMDPGAVTAYEPSLKAIQNKLAGAILLDGDKAGDSYIFCQQMESRLQSKGVVFHYGTAVDALKKQGSEFQLSLAGDSFVFDRLVIAAGNGSPTVARKLGIRLPMKPSKGFSFTVPMDNLSVKPQGPIVDITTRSGINPLGGKKLRYVGGAEFAGFDKSTPKEYWQKAENFFSRVLPEIDIMSLIEDEQPWIGYRPMSVDGVPMIGPTKVPGLYVNTAQGWLGWTMAAGSAQLLVDLMLPRENDSLPLDAKDYDLSRFS